MTAKEPAQRYATPQELADALAPLAADAGLAGLSGDAPAAAPAAHEAPTVNRHVGPAALTTVSAPRVRVRPRRRTLAFLALGGAVFLLLVAATLYRVFAPPGKQGNADAPHSDAADPILAAGDAPRPLDDLTPNLAHDLLDRAPVQAYWKPPDATAFRTYDPVSKQFAVNSPREGLFHLGTISRPTYTLRVRIAQAQWGRGAGIYLGYHDAADAEHPTSFQYLIFSERTTVAGVPVRVLSRGKCQIRDLGDRKLFSMSEKASQDVDEPVQDASVVVEVVRRRLFRVFVDGLELKELAEPANMDFTDTDYRGGLGLLTSANSCVLCEASLTLLPNR